jgi:hypothetical protein
LQAADAVAFGADAFDADDGGWGWGHALASVGWTK